MKKTSLAKLAAAAPIERNRKSWFYKLAADQRGELADLKVNFVAGRIPGKSRAWLRRFVNENLKLSISRDSFENWLNEGTPNE